MRIKPFDEPNENEIPFLSYSPQLVKQIGGVPMNTSLHNSPLLCRT
jgi:hypothetical protein